MATIRREISIANSADRVWDAMRDFFAVHERVAPGFVVQLERDGADRMLVFSNGSQAREALVSSDDAARRLVYAVIGGRLRAHSAAVEILEHEAGTCRLVWTTDLLPDELAPYIESQMDLAGPIMQRTLERQ